MVEDLSQYVWEKLKILTGDLQKAVKEKNREIVVLAVRQVGAFEPFLAQVAAPVPKEKGLSVKKVRKTGGKKGLRSFILDERQIKILSMTFGLQGFKPTVFVDIVREMCPKVGDTLVSVGNTLDYIKMRGAFNMAMRKVEYVVKDYARIKGGGHIPEANVEFYEELFAKHGSDFEALAKFANYNQNVHQGNKPRGKRRKRPFRHK